MNHKKIIGLLLCASLALLAACGGGGSPTASPKTWSAPIMGGPANYGSYGGFDDGAGGVLLIASATDGATLTAQRFNPANGWFDNTALATMASGTTPQIVDTPGAISLIWRDDSNWLRRDFVRGAGWTATQVQFPVEHFAAASGSVVEVAFTATFDGAILAADMTPARDAIRTRTWANGSWGPSVLGHSDSTPFNGLWGPRIVRARNVEVAFERGQYGLGDYLARRGLGQTDFVYDQSLLVWGGLGGDLQYSLNMEADGTATLFRSDYQSHAVRSDGGWWRVNAAGADSLWPASADLGHQFDRFVDQDGGTHALAATRGAPYPGPISVWEGQTATSLTPTNGGNVPTILNVDRASFSRPNGMHLAILSQATTDATGTATKTLSVSDRVEAGTWSTLATIATLPGAATTLAYRTVADKEFIVGTLASQSPPSSSIPFVVWR